MKDSERAVLVDLDGTLIEYGDWTRREHFGEPFGGAADFLAGLQKKYKVIIFSTRGCAAAQHGSHYSPAQLKALIANFLDKNGLPYDEVYIGQGKPLCSAIIDDRAVKCSPVKSSNTRAYYAMIEEKIDRTVKYDDEDWGITAPEGEEKNG